MYSMKAYTVGTLGCRHTPQANTLAPLMKRQGSSKRVWPPAPPAIQARYASHGSFSALPIAGAPSLARGVEGIILAS